MVKKTAFLGIFISFFMMWGCADESGSERITGIWRQGTSAETVMYLEFTADNRLKAYHKFPGSDCYVAIMDGETAMDFRQIENRELIFFVMGSESRLGYQISDGRLSFTFGENDVWARTHGSFLRDTYTYSGEKLEGCIIPADHWRKDPYPVTMR